MDLSERFRGVVYEALWATMACHHGQEVEMRLPRTTVKGEVLNFVLLYSCVVEFLGGFSAAQIGAYSEHGDLRYTQQYSGK